MTNHPVRSSAAGTRGVAEVDLDGVFGRTTAGNDDFASIVTERHADRLENLLADHGGTVAFGGEVDIEARHVEPTVIIDPAADSSIMQEEIFGPLLAVLTVESMSEAVEFVNGREKPLALYVFAEDNRAPVATTAGRIRHVLQPAVGAQEADQARPEAPLPALHGKEGKADPPLHLSGRTEADDPGCRDASSLLLTSVWLRGCNYISATLVGRSVGQATRRDVDPTGGHRLRPHFPARKNEKGWSPTEWRSLRIS